MYLKWDILINDSLKKNVIKLKLFTGNDDPKIKEEES
jgi:hypothetical protein